jgi:CRP-like cAMP-binding protein
MSERKESYERQIKRQIEEGEGLPKKLDISLVRYFWQASPMASKRSDSIPRFFKKIKVLDHFSDNELRIFSKYVHLRTFTPGERIFSQNDLGIGLYFIYSGQVDVIVEKDPYVSPTEREEKSARHILVLEKFDYFGELALLQENSIRNATVVSREQVELLGIFKPDLEALINDYPVIGTKLIQAISIIITNRLFSLTKEVKRLKYKLKQYEKENEV